MIIYSFSENLNFLSFISVIGTYSFNLLIISIFSIPALYILRKSKKEIIVCAIFLLKNFFLFYYGSFYKNKFISNDLKQTQYLIRIIGSNISLDRFYDITQTESVINELISLSSPDEKKKTFFLWPEGIIPGAYQDELYLYNDLFKKFFENHIIGLGITSKITNENDNKFFNSSQYLIMI